MISSTKSYITATYSTTSDFVNKCTAKIKAEPAKATLAAIGLVGAAYGAYALSNHFNNGTNVSLTPKLPSGKFSYLNGTCNDGFNNFPTCPARKFSESSTSSTCPARKFSESSTSSWNPITVSSVKKVTGLVLTCLGFGSVAVYVLMKG